MCAFVLLAAMYMPNSTVQVTCTYDGKTATLYTNGKQRGSGPGGVAQSNAGDPLLLGYTNDGYFFEGAVTEVRPPAAVTFAASHTV
jgi:hypothetical protein